VQDLSAHRPTRRLQPQIPQVRTQLPQLDKRTRLRHQGRITCLQILEGKRMITPASQEQLDFEKVKTLSPSQYQVFLALADGLGTKEIACKLFRSVKTIETHTSSAKKKLGLAHCDALRCFAAKFVCIVGRPALGGKKISREFVFETTK
jgi:DNA-binding NarL/FixJ family response regulator